MEEGEEEGEEGEAACGPRDGFLAGGPAVGECCLDTGLDLAGIDPRQRQLGKGLQVRDAIGNTGHMLADVDAVGELEDVCASEVVGGEGAEGAVEDGAEVEGEVEGLHAVDVDEEVGGDVDVGFDGGGGDVEEDGGVGGEVDDVELLDEDELGGLAVGDGGGDCGGGLINKNF